MTTQPAPELIALVGETEAEIITQNAAEIDRLTCNLVDQVGSAIIHVGQAQDAITRLLSNEVYDIEFAEGAEGPDVIAELMTAARALRHVERMAVRRREMILADEREREAAAVVAKHARQTGDGWDEGEDPYAGTDPQA